MLKKPLLMPGDTFMFRSKGWLGKAISWFQWRPGHGHHQYSHIAGYLGHGLCVDMNPGGPKTYKLKTLLKDAEIIDVARTQIDGKFPFAKGPAVKRLVKSIDAHMDMKYAYGTEIGLALIHGLISRAGFDWVTRLLMKRDNPADLKGTAVCSSWWRERQQDALGRDLFPQYGKGRVKPSNWLESPFTNRIS